MSQRKSWTLQQDMFIKDKVKLNQKLPEKDRLKWGDIADQLNKKFVQSGRTGKQCRQRWHNQLDPSISHDIWSVQQQKKLFQLQKKLGNKWAQIAAKLDGRTDNNVKNYFYSTLRKSLRKLNSFIMSNKAQLKTAKQFKQNSLSKLLAVADHKFDKKINIKKDTAQSQAVDIKNLLIEITHVEITDPKYKKLFINLTQKLQEFNKNCKKKKGKRKQDPEQLKHYDQSLNQIDEQVDEENQDQNQEQQSQEEEIIQKRPKSIRRSSKNNKNNKKESSQSVKKIPKTQPIKKIKNQKLAKQKTSQTSKLSNKQSFSLVNRNSESKRNSLLEASKSFHDLRSSLDFGKPIDNSGSLASGSQLFQSFHIGEQQKNEVPLKKKNSNRVLRQQSGFSFFNDIPQLNMKKKQSRQSLLINDFIQQIDFNEPKFFHKRSSIRQLPFLNDQMSKIPSNMSFNAFLDNSIRYEPGIQLKKLRSFSKKNEQSNNFAMGQYEF